MCAIIGSYSIDTIKNLIVLNSKRGSFSYSITAINYDFNILYMIKEFGLIDIKKLEEIENAFYIIHIQAPTTSLEKNTNNIHPATNKNYFLWHNGILKSYYIKYLQSKFNTDNIWDTYLLLLNINDKENIDGTFSCVMLEEGKGLYLFRNEDSPMFYDEYMNFSSTKFEKSKYTIPYNVYSINLKDKKIIIDSKWKSNLSSPYFFLEN